MAFLVIYYSFQFINSLGSSFDKGKVFLKELLELKSCYTWEDVYNRLFVEYSFELFQGIAIPEK